MQIYNEHNCSRNVGCKGALLNLQIFNKQR